MVVHVVLFKWQSDASPDAIDRVVEALRGLQRQVPGILDLSCGANFGTRGHGFCTGLVVRFADRAALDAYAVHPAHQAVVHDLIAPIREDIIAVDYET